MDQVLKIIVSNNDEACVFDIDINKDYLSSIPDILKTINEGIMKDLEQKKGGS